MIILLFKLIILINNHFHSANSWVFSKPGTEWNGMKLTFQENKKPGMEMNGKERNGMEMNGKE
jgi:hypothetical protein